MKISYSLEEQALQREVRVWLERNMPEEIRDQTLGGSTLDVNLQRDWHRMLFEKGWIAPEFPKEMGGAGLSETEQFLFNYEYGRSGAPRLKTKLMSLGMLAPLLVRFGTKEQQERFIPGLLSGRTVWCQGFSEPNAGSDLASLNTKAVLEEDTFVVNGQKTWTSMADYADWIFMLVRTDSSVKKQDGISFFLVDLKSPGITIRPIEAITDHAPFCEIFFDNVRVPKANLVGKINEGWRMARALLEHERLNGFPIGELLDALEKVRRNAEQATFRGRPLIRDGVFRRKLAAMEMDCNALLFTFFRILSRLKVGSTPGPETSVLKVFGAELYQRVLDLNMEAMGPYGQSWYNQKEFGNSVHQATTGWVNSRSLTIWGGASEIQRTIIATKVLKMPRR